MTEKFTSCIANDKTTQCNANCDGYNDKCGKNRGTDSDHGDCNCDNGGDEATQANCDTRTCLTERCMCGDPNAKPHILDYTHEQFEQFVFDGGAPAGMTVLGEIDTACADEDDILRCEPVVPKAEDLTLTENGALKANLRASGAKVVQVLRMYGDIEQQTIIIPAENKQMRLSYINSLGQKLISTGFNPSSEEMDLDQAKIELLLGELKFKSAADCPDGTLSADSTSPQNLIYTNSDPREMKKICEGRIKKGSLNVIESSVKLVGKLTVNVGTKTFKFNYNSSGNICDAGATIETATINLENDASDSWAGIIKGKLEGEAGLKARDSSIEDRTLPIVISNASSAHFTPPSAALTNVASATVDDVSVASSTVKIFHVDLVAMGDPNRSYSAGAKLPHQGLWVSSDGLDPEGAVQYKKDEIVGKTGTTFTLEIESVGHLYYGSPERKMNAIIVEDLSDSSNPKLIEGATTINRVGDSLVTGPPRKVEIVGDGIVKINIDELSIPDPDSGTSQIAAMFVGVANSYLTGNTSKLTVLLEKTLIKDLLGEFGQGAKRQANNQRYH